VKAFFARRPVFEAPTLAWPRRLLAGIFLRRSLLAWVLVWVALLGGALLAANVRQPAALSQPATVTKATGNGLGWRRQAGRQKQTAPRTRLAWTNTLR
jgi:hypothetical protein